MNLIEERNSWRKEMEAGKFTPHPLYNDYLTNRESDLWRSSRQLERIFEYIMYLEEKVLATNLQPIGESFNGKIIC